jgi:hypothetical protein
VRIHVTDASYLEHHVTTLDRHTTVDQPLDAIIVVSGDCEWKFAGCRTLPILGFAGGTARQQSTGHSARLKKRATRHLLAAYILAIRVLDNSTSYWLSMDYSSAFIVRTPGTSLAFA